MPRPSNSIDSIFQTAVRDVVARVSGTIAAAIAKRVADELERQLPKGAPRALKIQKRAGRPVRRRPRGEEITRWVADKRARRVPTFVIELTGGLDTKKKIVAKYGEGVVFRKGEPVPKTKAA